MKCSRFLFWILGVAGICGVCLGIVPGYVWAEDAQEVDAAAAAILSSPETVPINDPSLLNEQGVVLLKEEKYLAAAELFESAIQLDESNVDYKSNLAIAYNKHAIAKLQEREVLESIYYFKEALDLGQLRNIIKKNLSIAYLHLATQKIKEGAFDDAIQCHGKALEFDAENAKHDAQFGEILYAIGVNFYRKKEYDQAKKYLSEALLYRPHNASVYSVLGDIAYFEQDLTKAAEYYEKSVNEKNITADLKKEVDAKIKKVADEKEVEGTLTSYSSGHFIILYDKRTVEISGYTIREALRSAYREIGKSFGYYPRTKVPVTIYNRKEFSEKSEDGHGGIRAMYDGKIRLPVSDTLTDEYKSLIHHEYTHAVIHELGGVMCPTWLNEGLAQVEESKIVDIRMTRLSDLRRGKHIPFDTIFASANAGVPVDDHELFYQQSYLMVKYLLSRYQLYRIKQILMNIKKGQNFSSAFYGGVYMKMNSFEEKWLSYIKENKF